METSSSPFSGLFSVPLFFLGMSTEVDKCNMV